MKDPDGAVAEGCGMFSRLDTQSCRLDAKHGNGWVGEKMVEKAHRIAPAAHTGNEKIRIPAFRFPDLAPGLLSDDHLEIAHHHGIGMRSRHRPYNIVGVSDSGHPVPDCLVHRILQGAASSLHRGDGGAEKLHAKHIQGLPVDVLGAHVDLAFQPEHGRGRGCGHPVLPCAGLRNDAGLFHATGKEHLAQGIVDLVGAGMAQILPLEVDPAAPEMLRQAPGEIEGGGPSRIVVQVVSELILEFPVLLCLEIGRLELLQGRHEGLGHIFPPVWPEMAGLIRAARALYVLFHYTSPGAYTFSGTGTLKNGSISGDHRKSGQCLLDLVAGMLVILKLLRQVGVIGSKIEKAVSAQVEGNDLLSSFLLAPPRSTGLASGQDRTLGRAAHPGAERAGPAPRRGAAAVQLYRARR